MKLLVADWLMRMGRVGILLRISMLCIFLGCLMLSTALVSVEFAGKYTIAYQPNQSRVIFSFVCAALLAIALPSKLNRIDRLIIWLLVIMSALPLLIPYALAGASPHLMLSGLAFWFMLALQSKISIERRLAVPSFRGGWWPLGFLLGAIMAYSVLTAVLWAGVTPTLEFSQVYEKREQYLSKDIPLDTYFYKWTAFVGAPLLFFLGIERGKRWISVVAIVVLLILYTATGHKSYLFLIPFIGLVYWVWTRRNAAVWLVSTLVGTILIGMISYYTLDDTRLNASLSNRLYVLPAKITYEYHDYFSDHPKVQLSHSVFSNFVDYPYSQKPPHVISTVYYDNPEGYPNTGIVGDAFMNFGYPALVVLFFLSSATLRLIAWLSRGKSQLLTLGLVLMPLFTWVNSGFLTSFLTSGLAFGVVGLLLLPHQSGRAGNPRRTDGNGK